MTVDHESLPLCLIRLSLRLGASSQNQTFATSLRLHRTYSHYLIRISYYTNIDNSLRASTELLQLQVSLIKYQRIMSRFSTLSYIFNIRPARAQPQTSANVAPDARRRSRLSLVLRKHPKNIIYALILCGISIGMAVGLAVSLNGRTTGDGYRGGPAINAFFVLAYACPPMMLEIADRLSMIIVTLLAIRQLLFIYRLFFPVPAHHPALPPWLIGRPPTYAEALDYPSSRPSVRDEESFSASRGRGNLARGRGTGDVEDGIIAQNEALPKYGEERGSTLLARGEVPAPSGVMSEVDVGVIPSYAAAQMEGMGVVSGGIPLRTGREQEHEMSQVIEATRPQYHNARRVDDTGQGRISEGNAEK